MKKEFNYDEGQENENAPDPGLDQEQGEFEEVQQSEESQVSADEQTSVTGQAKWLFLGAIILVLVIFVVFFNLTKTTNKKATESSQGTNEVVANNEEVVSEKEVHYLGVLPLHNPSVMVNQFGEVEKYLNENTSLTVELKLYPTSGELGGYTAVVKDVSEGKVSFAYLASVTTVQANGNGPVTPFACAQKNGSPTYKGDLVVKADSPYQSLEDLKGKKVSGTSKSSTSGNLMPSSWLKSLEIDPTTYFEGGMMYLGSHDKAIQAVIKGTIDGAFINESTMYKFNKDTQVTRSLWRHDPVPEFPFVVNTDKVTPAELQEVKTALLKMHETNLSGIQNVEPNYEKWVELNWEDCLGIKTAIDDVYGPDFYDLEKWGK